MRYALGWKSLTCVLKMLFKIPDFQISRCPDLHLSYTCMYVFIYVCTLKLFKLTNMYTE